ncbi:MAG: CAP domain-containing protein [Anaeromyxobacteraceae bacterium]
MAKTLFPRLGRGAGVLALALGAVACAGMQAGRKSPGAISDGAFAPTQPASPQYGPDAALACASSGAVAALASNLDDAAGKAGQARPQLDGRLCAVAGTLLSWDDKALVPQGLLRALANHFGAVGPAPRAIVSTLETDDSRAIADRLSEAAQRYTAQAKVPTRVGAVTQRLRKGQTKVVVVVQEVPVELEPVPKAAAADGKVTVAGKLVGDVANARVVACDPSGKLQEPAGTGGKEFRAEVSCGARPGILAVEIRGGTGGSDESLARFPVGCGVALPTRIAIAAPGSGPAEPAQAARMLFDAANAERAAAGLGPLKWDDAVAGVARSAAEALRDSTGTQVTFNLAERLRQAEVSSPLIVQNAAAAVSVEDARATIESSPRDRAQLLNPALNNGAVGTTYGATPEGVGVLYAVEILTRENPPIDPAALTAQLRTAIDQRRADARGQKLSDDPLLAEVAQRYAAALAAGKGTIPKERESQIVAPLYKVFRTVNIMAGVKPNALEFAEEPGIVSADKLVGVGIAPGQSAALGKNSAYVVVLTGTRR